MLVIETELGGHVMDRSAQIAKRSLPDGQARSANNLAFKIKHIDPEYWLQVCELERTETGLLALFLLVPQVSSRETFRVRIDDGSPNRRKELEVDIDILDASKSVQDDFKAGRQGYSGHHSVRDANNSQRIFSVCIRVANQPIFDAEVSFNLAFLVGISEIGRAEDHIDATVSRV